MKIKIVCYVRIDIEGFEFSWKTDPIERILWIKIEATWKGINGRSWFRIQFPHCYLTTLRCIRFHCATAVHSVIPVDLSVSAQNCCFNANYYFLTFCNRIYILHLFITLSLYTAYSCMFAYSFIYLFECYIKKQNNNNNTAKFKSAMLSTKKCVWPWQYVFLPLFFDTFRVDVRTILSLFIFNIEVIRDLFLFHTYNIVLFILFAFEWYKQSLTIHNDNDDSNFLSKQCFRFNTQ